MKYTVLLKPHTNGRVLATVPALPECQCIGSTEAEALGKIRAAIHEIMRKTKVVHIEVDDDQTKDAWDETIGVFADDETFDDFQDEIRKYRVTPEDTLPTDR